GVIRDRLQPYGDGMADGLWEVVGDGSRADGERLRAAGLLAAFTPNDSRWTDRAADLAALLLKLDARSFRAWVAHLEPAQPFLAEPLAASLHQPQRRGLNAAGVRDLLLPQAPHLREPAVVVAELAREPRLWADPAFQRLLDQNRPQVVDRLLTAVTSGPLKASWKDQPFPDTWQA